MAKVNVFSGLAIGLVAGALIGSGTALLSAPQAGAKTRTLLKEKSDGLRERALVSLQETRKKADSLIADVRTRSEEMAERSRSDGRVTMYSQEILAE